MLPRSLAALVAPAALSLALPVLAQESKPQKPVVEASHPKTTPFLQKLLTAKEAQRAEALIAFIEDQIGTNAIYAGQYNALKQFDWVQPLLQKWITTAPLDATNPGAFRNACISALRDVVPGKGSDELRASLKMLAEDDLENVSIRNRAMYALAQFGDRSFVDGVLKKAKGWTESEQANDQARGWMTLADVHYNLREYKEAVKSYLNLLKLIKDGKVRMAPQRLPTTLYNCACSMALAGMKDQALKMVESALETGKRAGAPLNKRLLKTDMDIQSLRGDERFAALIQKYYGPKKDGAGKDGLKDRTTSKPTSRPAGK